MGIATLTKSAELQSAALHTVTDEELQKLHGILLDITDDFADICAEYNIPWILTGGSALGAARHQGFIPWDDDMDFSMQRKDFERFKKVFPGKYEDKYELKLPGEEGYIYHFPKIYRKNTIAQTIQSPQNMQEPVSIDIFIIENISNNKLLRLLHGLLSTMLLMIVSMMRMKRCKYNLLKYGASSPQLCAAVKKRTFFAGFFSFLTLEQWLKAADRVFSMCKNDSSAYISIPSGVGHYFGEIFLREKLCHSRTTDFEGRSYFVPQQVDYYLRIRYGEGYMEIPQVKNRERHTFVRFNIDKLD